MAYKDLRDFVEQIDKIGQLIKLEGVSWDLEATAIAEMTSKAVLFDSFSGYPRGYRLLVNFVKSFPAWQIGMNIQTEARGNALVKELHDRLRAYEPVPPKWVDDGPVLENIQESKDIDIFSFPVPKCHPDDVGRYIGTADAVIMKDPDSGLINFGTFRLQAHDSATLGLYTAPGKDGAIIVQNYHSQNKPCPVVVLVGVDPAIFTAASQHVVHPDEEGEYGFVGWLLGEPVEVIKGEFTGLPIPARTEIAIEGEVLPGDTKREGPFGEWFGYSEATEHPVIRVKRIMHRSDPILTVQSPAGLSSPPAMGEALVPEAVPGHLAFRAAMVWDQMERAGIRGIQGVAWHVSRLLQVVSIKNLYVGHARQAGHVAAQCHGGAFKNKYVIVVDDNIDPSNLKAVMWAVARHADPERRIDIVRYAWGDLIGSYPLYEEGKEPVSNSKAVIDATRPFEWGENIHKPVVFSPEFKKQVAEKWGKFLSTEKKG